MGELNRRIVKLELISAQLPPPIPFGFDRTAFTETEAAKLESIGGRLFHLASDERAQQYIERLSDDDITFMIDACGRLITGMTQ